MDAKKYIEVKGEVHAWNTAFSYMLENPTMIVRPAKKLVLEMQEKHGSVKGIPELYPYIEEKWLNAQYGKKKTSRLEKFIKSYLERVYTTEEMLEIKQVSNNPILLALENEFDDMGVIAECSSIYRNADYSKKAKYAILNVVAHHYEHLLRNVEEMLYSVLKVHQQEI